MLSKETLERYRRMTTGQRLQLTLESIDQNESALLAGRPEVVERRFQLLHRENDARNARLVQTLYGEGQAARESSS